MWARSLASRIIVVKLASIAYALLHLRRARIEALLSGVSLSVGSKPGVADPLDVREFRGGGDLGDTADVVDASVLHGDQVRGLQSRALDVDLYLVCGGGGRS